MKLGILSDLHIGKNAIAADLRPEGQAGLLSCGTTDYVDTFLRFATEQQIKVDALLIPGDITEAGQPAEVDLASKVVERLSQGLRCNPHHIAFVPGNHDVDWAVTALPDATGFRLSQRYSPIRSDRWVFSGIAARSVFPTESLFESPYCGVWLLPELAVVGYNSSFRDVEENLDHYGVLDPEHVRLLRSYLDKVRSNLKDKCRVLMVHHHFFPSPTSVTTSPDSSILVNAPALIELAAEFRFDIVLHGHTHQPKCQTVQINGGHPVVCVSAGTFSLGPSSDPDRQPMNHFHVAEITGRDQDGSVYGCLHSWAFVMGRGWTRSEDSLGLPGRRMFGPHMYEDRLRQRLEQMLDQLFCRSRSLRMRELFRSMPELEGLERADRTKYLTELSSAKDFYIQGDTSDPDTRLFKPSGGTNA